MNNTETPVTPYGRLGRAWAEQSLDRSREMRYETRTTIPCGWCDEPVTVAEDHGQVVYCSEAHERSNVYTPNVEGNL